jgi:cyclophilin family peptidyl-prolyl cis-trans isomerase
MANAGPDTNGSQFFIMHQDYALSPNYVIFARVTAGSETHGKDSSGTQRI